MGLENPNLPLVFLFCMRKGFAILNGSATCPTKHSSQMLFWGIGQLRFQWHWLHSTVRAWERAVGGEVKRQCEAFQGGDLHSSICMWVTIPQRDNFYSQVEQSWIFCAHFRFNRHPCKVPLQPVVKCAFTWNEKKITAARSCIFSMELRFHRERCWHVNPWHKRVQLSMTMLSLFTHGLSWTPRWHTMLFKIINLISFAIFAI